MMFYRSVKFLSSIFKPCNFYSKFISGSRYPPPPDCVSIFDPESGRPSTLYTVSRGEDGRETRNEAQE